MAQRWLGANGECANRGDNREQVRTHERGGYLRGGNGLVFALKRRQKMELLAARFFFGIFGMACCALCSREFVNTLVVQCIFFFGSS